MRASIPVACLLVAASCSKPHGVSFQETAADPVGFDVIMADPGAVSPGTTMFLDGSYPDAPRVVEVNKWGEVVWQHHVPHERYRGTAVMDTAPLPNGHALYSVDGTGLYEVNEAGETVWSFEDSQPSHDVDRLENGNTLFVNGWARKGEPHVVELDPAGGVVWSWDAVEQYDFPPYSDVELEGWIHANAAQRQPDGATLVSLRNFNMVTLIDADGSVLWDFSFSA
jgi:hypothetical protein